LTKTACRRLPLSFLSLLFFFFFFWVCFFQDLYQKKEEKYHIQPSIINQQTSCSSGLIVLCNNNDYIYKIPNISDQISVDYCVVKKNVCVVVPCMLDSFIETNFRSCKVPSSHLTFSCFQGCVSVSDLCSIFTAWEVKEVQYKSCMRLKKKKEKKKKRKSPQHIYIWSGKLKLNSNINSWGVWKKWKGTQILARLNQKKKIFPFSEWTRPISK